MTRVQTLDEAVYISLEKGINPNVFPSVMSKLSSRLGSLALVCQRVQEKEKSEFEPNLFHLKLTLHQIFPFVGRCCINMDIQIAPGNWEIIIKKSKDIQLKILLYFQIKLSKYSILDKTDAGSNATTYFDQLDLSSFHQVRSIIVGPLVSRLLNDAPDAVIWEIQIRRSWRLHEHENSWVDIPGLFGSCEKKIGFYTSK